MSWRISGSNLTQAQRQLRVVLQLTAHETVFARASFMCYGASIIGRSDAILLHQREDAQNAAHGNLALIAIDDLAQSADMRLGYFGAVQHW